MKLPPAPRTQAADEPPEPGRSPQRPSRALSPESGEPLSPERTAERIAERVTERAAERTTERVTERAADREATTLSAPHPCAPLLGESRAAAALRARIDAAAAVDTPVLFEGERGCGREHLSRYLHARSHRRGAAFIRIDVEFADTERAADKLRRAHGGSVLIRDLPHGSARLSKLLAHWLDKNLAGSAGEALPLRVLATSDVELPRLLDAGLVDAELLARLQIMRLPVPPLRERAADIPLLCAHFLAELAVRGGTPPRTLSPRAVDQLARYSFPGNLAELRDVIRRSALRARSPVIELGDVEAVLPPLHERVPLEELSLEAVVRTKVRALLQRLEGYPITDLYEQVLSHIERPLLEEVLARTAGNQLKAAAMLGINRNTLRKKLQERAVPPAARPPAPGRPLAPEQ